MRKKTYLFAYKMIKPYLLKQIVGILIIIISSFLVLLNPYVSKQIVDVAIANRDLSSLYKYIGIFILLFFSNQALSICNTYVFSYISEKLMYDMRMKLFRSVSGREITFFNDRQVGELTSRIINEIPDASELFVSTFQNITAQIATLLITLFMIYSINTNIFIFMLITIPIVFFILKYSNPKLKAINELLMKDGAEMHNSLQSNLMNMKLIKYMRIYRYANTKFSKTIHQYVKDKFKYVFINMSVSFLLSLVYFIPTLAIFFYGGYLVIQQAITIGALIALSAYVSSVFSPIRQLSNINIEVQRCIVAYKRYLELVDMEDTYTQKRRFCIEKLSKGISLRNIYFEYNEKNKIFDNFNLHIPVGATVQLKGCNGSGKSTLINLLCGILKPHDGTIEYDGIDIASIKNGCIRDMVGVVSQNTYLFNDTIRNNITVGRYIEDKDIIHLSEQLNIDDIVCSEEINLDTVITNNGGNVSGGQAQKISILRALCAFPQILILDEASTFLDINTKQSLYKYLCNNRNDNIIINISHEESSLIEADVIINMDDMCKISENTEIQPVL